MKLSHKAIWFMVLLVLQIYISINTTAEDDITGYTTFGLNEQKAKELERGIYDLKISTNSSVSFQLYVNTDNLTRSFITLFIVCADLVLIHS